MSSLFCYYGSGDETKRNYQCLIDRLFHFEAFPYMHYSQNYRASNTKDKSLKNRCEPL